MTGVPRPDWAWKPDDTTVKAIASGNAKVRRSYQTSSTDDSETQMATKKTKAKKGKKKLDGKKLAAQRKPRDSVAQFIKDELEAGRSDVARIIEKAKSEFPKSNPTPGYVRFIAKSIGKYKQVEPERGVAKPKAKKEKKAKKAKKDKPARADGGESKSTEADPAS